MTHTWAAVAERLGARYPLLSLVAADLADAQRTMIAAAAHSDLFAHRLIWALNSEERPPEEAFSPEVKRCACLLCSCMRVLFSRLCRPRPHRTRVLGAGASQPSPPSLPPPSPPPNGSSGWQPPKDTGLWEIAARVRGEVEGAMTPAQREYWAAEGGYFEQVRVTMGGAGGGGDFGVGVRVQSVH